MRGADATDDTSDDTAVASHWLRGAGRPALLRALGLRDRAGARWAARPWRRAAPLALLAYLGTLSLGTAGLVGWMLLRQRQALPAAAPPSVARAGRRC